ncbi:MAG: hypothetical protein NTZ16_02980 [Verrucomicrobia bacterium]|nr:hypothetical protein [Verrucomicrobiota bacterium]
MKSLTVWAGVWTLALTAAATPKPIWLTELSLACKEGYDDNILLSGSGNTRDQSSWFTTISPKVTVDLAPLLQMPQLPTAAFGYAPDFVAYHSTPTENYSAHRFTQSIKGRAGAFSGALENCFTYVAGSETGPTYPEGRNCYSTIGVRERREQFQARGKASLQYDGKNWFARLVANWLDYDLMTEIRSAPGYDNYADRLDLNGGFDCGYKITPGLAAMVGYRYGHQFQQQYFFNLDSSPGDYQRVLFGLEGKLCSWLTMTLQAGPDFRDYAANTTTHTTPISNPNLVTYYAEAQLTAQASAADTFAFKYKQWQWVSSTGCAPYFDSTYDGSYNHKFDEHLSLDLGARLLTADYRSGSSAKAQRVDLQYAVYEALHYAINPHWSLEFAYTAEFGRNDADIANASTREYNRNLVSLGAQYKF